MLLLNSRGDAQSSELAEVKTLKEFGKVSVPGTFQNPAVEVENHCNKEERSSEGEVEQEYLWHS